MARPLYGLACHHHTDPCVEKLSNRVVGQGSRRLPAVTAWQNRGYPAGDRYRASPRAPLPSTAGSRGRQQFLAIHAARRGNLFQHLAALANDHALMALALRSRSPR